MFSSWRIGRPFGIDLYIHWTFWLLPLWIMYSYDRTGPISLGFQLGLVFALFVCVVLHELGHALTARAFGIGTESITLSPLGGLAKLGRMSWQPLEEFCIAVAGPLVNVVIAAILGTVLLFGSLLRPGLMETTGGTFLGLLLVMNIVMVVFNLLPAFPMDGGRVLRSALASFMGVLPATRIAAYVGIVTAVLFGFVAPVLLPEVFRSPFLPLIAVFIAFMGLQELFALEARARLAAAREAIPTVTLAPRWQPVSPGVIVYIWDPHRQGWIRQPGPAA